MVNYEQRKLSPSLNKAEQFVKLKRGNSFKWLKFNVMIVTLLFNGLVNSELRAQGY